MKNECAQEMLLDLVFRHGCEVKLKSRPDILGNVLEIVISHKGVNSAVTIDLTRFPGTNISQEEIVCRNIERAAMDLFRYPFRGMYDKHFREGDPNA